MKEKSNLWNPQKQVIIEVKMRNNEICIRHKTTVNQANQKDYKLSLVCMHKNCPEKFKLCCMKCRTEFHKDHTIKLLAWVELTKDIERLRVQVNRRQVRPPELFQLQRKLVLIREFRLNVHVSEAGLITVSQKLLTMVTDYQSILAEQLERLQKQSMQLKQSDSTEKANNSLQKLKQIVQYNSIKMKIDLYNDKYRSFEQSRGKLLTQAELLVGRMKEYLMKIIEVLLDKPQQDYTRRPKVEPQTQNSAEEIRKLLKQEAITVQREYSEKGALLQSIKVRLEALQDPSQIPIKINKVPNQKQNSQNSISVETTTTRNSRRQIEQKSPHTSGNKLTNDLNDHISELESQVKDLSKVRYDLEKQINANNEQMMRLTTMLAQRDIQISDLNNKLDQQIAKVQQNYQKNKLVKKRYDQDLDKYKKRYERSQSQKLAATKDLADISEQYNELIDKFNILKDQHRQSELLLQKFNIQTQISKTNLDQLNKQLSQNQSIYSGKQRQLQSLKKDLHIASKQIEQLKTEIVDLKQKNSQMKTELDSSKGQARDKKLENDKIRKQSTQLRIQCQQLKTDAKRFKFDLDKMKQEQQNSFKMTKHIEQEYQKLKQQCLNIKDEKGNLQIQILELSTANKQCTKQANNLQEQNDKMKRLVEQLMNENVNLKKSVQDLQVQINDQKVRTQQILLQVSSIQSQFSHQQTNKQVLHSRIQQLSLQQNLSLSTIQQLQNQNMCLANDREKALQQLHQAQEALAQKEYSITEMNQQLALQTSCKNDVEKTLANTHLQLRKKESLMGDQLSRLHNQLTNAYEVNRELETKFRQSNSNAKQLQEAYNRIQQQNASLHHKIVSFQEVQKMHKSQFTTVNKEYKRVSLELSGLFDELNKAESSLKRVSIQNTKLNNENKKLAELKSETQSILSQLQISYKQLQRKLQTAESSLIQLQKQNQFLAKELSNKSIAFQQFSQNILREHNIIERNFQCEKQRLGQMLEGKSIEITNLQDKFAQSVRSICCLQGKCEQLASIIKNHENESNTNRKSISLLEKEVQKFNTLNAGLNQKLLNKENQVNTTWQKIAELQGRFEGERRQLSALENYCQELRITIQKLQESNKRLEQLDEERFKELQKTHNEKSQLEKQLDQSRIQVVQAQSDFEKELLTKQKQIQEYALKINELQQHIKSVSNRLQSNLTVQSQQTDSRKLEYNTLFQVNKALKQKIEASEKLVEETEHQKNMQRAQIKIFTTELQITKKNYNRLKQTLESETLTRQRLEQQLAKCANQINIFQNEIKHLKLQNDRLQQNSPPTESNPKRPQSPKEFSLLTRQLNSVRDQLIQERTMNQQKSSQLEQLKKKMADSGKQKLINKQSQQYKLLNHILTTVKQDMRILEERVKDKDLIEKIYLRELEIKRAEVTRLMHENQGLKKAAGQQNHTGSTQVAMSLEGSRPEDGIVRLKNKQNKVTEKHFSERISTFLESIKK